MRSLLYLASLLFLFAMTPVKRKKIVFFGDSITQMGVEPGGYIHRIGTLLQKQGRGDNFELIGAGIGGNKVYDLYLRMEEDVLAKKPDLVVIYIGINDVWHKTFGTGTDLDKFEKFYVAIIKKLQAVNISVILCTPTVIGEKKKNANPQDTDLDAYSAVVRKLADTYKCRLVDLRRSFLRYEEEHNHSDQESGILTTDRVHLNDKGNTIVAEAILEAIDGVSGKAEELK